MKSKTRHLLIGIAIIVISIAAIYLNLIIFEESFKKLWPALILLVGMILYLYYFSTKRKGARPWALFTATFIAVLSVALFILTFTSFKSIRFVWPAFLLALGLGLLSLYIYGEKKKGNLPGSIIFITISFLIWIFYAVKTQFGLVIGLVLLITGAAFLTRGLIREPGLEAPHEAGEKGREGKGEGDEVQG